MYEYEWQRSHDLLAEKPPTPVQPTAPAETVAEFDARTHELLTLRASAEAKVQELHQHTALAEIAADQARVIIEQYADAKRAEDNARATARAYQQALTKHVREHLHLFRQ